MKLNRRELLSVSAAGLGTACLGVTCLPAVASSGPPAIVGTSKKLPATTCISSTGSKSLDKALDGGFRQGEIYTIIGEKGSGKSLWSHHIWDMNTEVRQFAALCIMQIWHPGSSAHSGLIERVEREANEFNQTVIIFVEIDISTLVNVEYHCTQLSLLAKLLSVSSAAFRIRQISQYLRQDSKENEFRGGVEVFYNERGIYGRSCFTGNPVDCSLVFDDAPDRVS